MQAHALQTQHPDLQRLLRSRKDGVGPIVKAVVTVVTCVALTAGCLGVKAALDDVCGRTRRAGDTVRPTSCAYRLLTLHLINAMRDGDLHRWTPVSDGGMGYHQCTPSSHSTTLESNTSV